ncbi:MAG: ABC transporter substrate-binding protein [Phycisphaerales bacterium]
MRRTLNVLILLLTNTLLCACSESSSPTAQSVEGAASETEESLRLAVLSPGMAVMLKDLGYEDQIVAKHDYDLVLSDQVPAAGSELGFDLEMLISADPTHVFFQRTSTPRSPSFLELAEQRGWVIFERPLDSLDDIATTMDDLYYFFDGPAERDPQSLNPSLNMNLNMDDVLMHETPSMKLAMSWDDLGPAADRAGRVLVLGSIDPIGAMGPGSYHYELVERLGATNAIADGAMWIEMDAEDLIAMNPDAILYIAPRSSTQADRFGEPDAWTLDRTRDAFGSIASLPINAMENDRIAVIDHPLGLLPSGALGDIADEIRGFMLQWDE